MLQHPLTMRVVKLALERMLEERPMLRPDFIQAAEVELARLKAAIADHERRRSGWQAKEGGAP